MTHLGDTQKSFECELAQATPKAKSLPAAAQSAMS